MNTSVCAFDIGSFASHPALAPVGVSRASALASVHRRLDELIMRNKHALSDELSSFTSASERLASIRPLVVHLHTSGSAGPILFALHEVGLDQVKCRFDAWHVEDEVATRFQSRLSVLAECLYDVGLQRPIAYEGQDGEVFVEVGQPGRTLTFVLTEVATLALYRSGSADDFGSVVALRMSQASSSVELERVARNYLASLICQTSPSTAMSPQTGSLAAA